MEPTSRERTANSSPRQGELGGDIALRESAAGHLGPNGTRYERPEVSVDDSHGLPRYGTFHPEARNSTR